MDASVSVGIFPPGIYLNYSGSSEPGWGVFANGQAISRTTYAKLFSIIGTTFGSGDGVTTFNVPNANGRALIGAGSYNDVVSGTVTRILGQSLGAEKHVISQSEMPSHNHNVSAAASGSGGGGFAKQNGAFDGSFSSANSGSNVAHNNMQPSLVSNVVITI